MSVSELSVANVELCKIDLVTVICLVRQRPEKGEGFNLGEFVEWSLFIPKKSPVIGNLLTYAKRMAS